MAAIDIVGLFKGGDSPTKCSAAIVEVGFGKNEVFDLTSKEICRFDGNGSAHAVSVDIYPFEVLCLDEAENLQRMVMDAIAEIVRAITVAKAQEIKKDKPPPSQGGCERHMRVLE